MPSSPPSAALRAQLRKKILKRIDELNLKDVEAADQLGIRDDQMSRLRHGEDIFRLDKLVDAAAGIRITVRMTIARPYSRTESTS